MAHTLANLNSSISITVIWTQLLFLPVVFLIKMSSFICLQYKRRIIIGDDERIWKTCYSHDQAIQLRAGEFWQPVRMVKPACTSGLSKLANNDLRKFLLKKTHTGLSHFNIYFCELCIRRQTNATETYCLYVILILPCLLKDLQTYT